MHSRHEPPRGSTTRIPLWLGFCVLLAAAVVLLWSEHKTHIQGGVIWGLLLLCPLAHVLMHGSHGGHGSPGAGHGAHDHDRHGREEP